MKQNIVITEPTEETAKVACDIAIKAWTPIREVFKKEMGEELYEAFFGNWKENKRKEVIENLSKGKGYVALIDGVVVGFICYKYDTERKTGEICTNAVSPDHRGMGIGNKMYNSVLSSMREKGIKYLSVHTGLDDGHIPARRAYEKLGFKKNLPSVDYYMKL